MLGQPGQCDYCYQAPVLLIVPSVLARASQLPSGSVAAYMSRLTFYGVSSPSIASVQVSSLYTLQVGVLDGIVSTAGYTGPPVYTLQSATSNVTAIQVATLTSAALYMTLRAVQLSVLETGSWSLLLTRAETTTLYSSSRLILSGASQLVVSGAVWTVAAGDSSAGLGLVFSSASRVQINASSSLVVRVPVTVPVGAALSIGLAGALTLSSPVSLSQATIQIAAGGALAASGYVTAASCQVSGAGTLYLSGGSSWSAGSQVTCAVQLSSGTHTLYDLDAQTWQPPLLVLGQPGQCDYCYQAPVLLIVPSVLARASQLPSGSVAAYMSRLTFYGVSSPSIASVQVSSLYTLQVGVLDGIVSTAGYTGPPVYTLQSATSNVTAIQVATLTSAALYMTLRAVQLSVLETGSWSLLLTRAETTTLYSSSRLILSGASQLVVSGAVWTVAAGDSSAGLGLVFSSASRVQINASSSLVVRVPVTVPVGAALSIGLAGALTLSSPVSLSQATIQIAAGGALAASGYVTAASCQVSGAGTLYLSGGSSWSAGSQVTCAVQLSSGTHTLYDLDAQTWQPPLLVLGQPGQCDYCYQAPVLLIVPSVLARASQLPSGSVAAYMSRLTFYGVSSPSIASVQVSSLYTLQVGVLDGIVSTAGYTGPPVYTLQSTSSVSAVIVVSQFDAAAFSATLVAVRMVAFLALLSGSDLHSLTLRLLSTFVIPAGGVLALTSAGNIVPALTIPYVANGNAVQLLGLLQLSGGARLSIGACFINNGTESVQPSAVLSLTAPAGACSAVPVSTSAYAQPAVIDSATGSAALIVAPSSVTYGASLAVALTGSLVPSAVNASAAALLMCRFSPSPYVSAGTWSPATASVLCVVPDVLSAGVYEMQLSSDGLTFNSQPLSSQGRARALLTVVDAWSAQATVTVSRVVTDSSGDSAASAIFVPGFNVGDVQTISWSCSGPAAASATNGSSPYCLQSAVDVLLMGTTPLYATDSIGDASGVGGANPPISGVVLAVILSNATVVSGQVVWTVPSLAPLLVGVAAEGFVLYVSVYFRSQLVQPLGALGSSVGSRQSSGRRLLANSVSSPCPPLFTQPLPYCCAVGHNVDQCKQFFENGDETVGCPPPPPPPPQPSGPSNGGSGDPHFTSWDGQYYNLSAEGRGRRTEEECHLLLPLCSQLLIHSYFCATFTSHCVCALHLVLFLYVFSYGKGAFWLVQAVNSSVPPQSFLGFSAQIFLAPLQDLSAPALSAWNGVTYTESLALRDDEFASVLVLQAVVGSPGVAVYVDGLPLQVALPAQGVSPSSSSHAFRGGQVTCAFSFPAKALTVTSLTLPSLCLSHRCTSPPP